MCKKLKTVDFINMWLFFLESEIFNFCICQKSTFARSYLEQVSSWVIKSKFCVYKVSIRRHFIKLTFSGLHFFILWPPWIFNRGLSNPQRTRNRQNASLKCGTLAAHLLPLVYWWVKHCFEFAAVFLKIWVLVQHAVSASCNVWHPSGTFCVFT